MEIVGPAKGTDALTNKDIIARFDSELTKVIQASADPAFEFERQILIVQARLNWEFVKNQHFTVPGAEITPFGNYADWSYFDPGLANSEETGPDIKLAPPVNVLGADLYKFMGVMAANAPRVKGVPDDVCDPDSIHSAFVADVNLRDLWWKQKIDRKWKALAFHQYTTGPGYIRTIWNADAKKYGQSIEPKIEIVQGPDGIPMPQQSGETAYANGDAEVQIYSVLDVAHAYEAKELDQVGWLRCQVMRSKWELLAKYCGCDGEPGPLDKWRESEVPDDDPDASAYTAAEAKEAVSTPSGTGRSKKPNFWRFTEWWLDPYLFEAILDQTVRAMLKEHFPDGLYVARVGSVTVEIDNRKITDEWAICRVGRGEKLLERPIASDVLPLNRAIDDLFGMSIETVLRAITRTVVDNQLLDREALNTNEAVPDEFILTTMPVDGDLNKRIFQVPPAHLSDQVRPLMEFARALMQDIDGIRPELAGGGAPTQTFREAKQRKDQALAQLAPQSQAMLDAAEATGKNLVRLRAKYGAGTVKAQRKTAYGSKTDVVDIASLKDEGWHVEADDNFPMTVVDQRDAVYSMLKEFPPEVQQALSILDPLNITKLTELLQIPGFQSATEEQVQKTLKRIDRLLAEEPVPGMPGPDGQPGPPSPSIQPDSWDNHQLVAPIMAKFMVANDDIRNGNPGGWANLVAAYEEEEKLAAPPPLPPPPPLKGSVSWTGKLEDFPNLVDEILKGEGLAGQPQAAAPPLPAGPIPSPSPVGQPSLEVPIPPLPGGPQGPQPMPIQ